MGNGPICIPICLFAALLAVPPKVNAQWIHHPTPGTPRLPDGKPNLSAKAPRLNGKPDLSGIWEAESTPKKELAVMFPPGVGLLPGGENGLGEDDPQKYFLNILADYKSGTEPLTPAASARLLEMRQHPPHLSSLCSPVGVPLTELLPAPYKIVQTRGLVLILFEANTVFRQVFMDGRAHPADPQPAFLGYSVGRWEGDTLVVEVAGFNSSAALDAMGHFHSEQLRVTERFHRRDFGHMDIEITLTDPEVFTRPVTIKSSQRLLPDTDLIENFCQEDERDLAHLTAIPAKN